MATINQENFKMFFLLKILLKIKTNNVFSMFISCKIYAVLYRQSY